MSSEELENLTSEFPDEAQAIKRFESFVRGRKKSLATVFTIERLYDRIQPTSLLSLALLLNELIRSGFIEKIVRVESPTTGGGLGDFESMEKVPGKIHDVFEDVDIEVDPANIKTLYRITNKLSDLTQ